MDWLVKLVDTIGVRATIAVFLFAMLLMLVAAVYQIATRSAKEAERRVREAERALKDADIISRTVEYQQHQLQELDEDITEHTAERWKLIGERIQVEENLKRCQEKLQEHGASSMTMADEKALRDMIVSQREEILRLRAAANLPAREDNE